MDVTKVRPVRGNILHITGSCRLLYIQAGEFPASYFLGGVLARARALRCFEPGCSRVPVVSLAALDTLPAGGPAMASSDAVVATARQESLRPSELAHADWASGA
jgi:hypothetical protein